MIESIASIPCNVELGSEYRYRNPIITAHTLMIAVSQSGETADTLACVSYAKKAQAQILAITNKTFSSLSRLADFMIDLNLGPEIGVASTKAFSGQVLALYILSLAFSAFYNSRLLGEVFDNLKVTSIKIPANKTKHLRQFIESISHTLNCEDQIHQIAKQLVKQKNCLYIGRNSDAWIGYEGALKLKEISYICAEAIPAGELKHGTLALIDAQMCLVAIAPCNNHYKKTLINIEEVKARGGRIFTLTTKLDQKLKKLSEQVIVLPHIDDHYLQSIVSAIALQLLAYHSAKILDKDIDQPRNLAKSVTVE